MKVYIAGPMRGLPDFNFPAFHLAADRLRDVGHVVFSPAERDIQRHGDIFRSRDGDEAKVQGFSLREALGADTAWICAHAEGIALLDGWEKSKGAQAEAALGRALGLLVAPVSDFDLVPA